MDQLRDPLSKRFLTRFIFCYIVLYVIPYGFEYIYAMDREYFSFWPSVTMYFGDFFLGFSYDQNLLRKGFDSKYDVARFLLCALLSVIVTIIWLAMDVKHRATYEDKLNALLKIILRYHVGLTLIMYGLCKVFPLQFGHIGIDTLESTLGNFPPMRFLWVFMSYSDFYTISTGVVEVIGGVLLLFRATTLLGSCILFVAMMNVVLIDIGYDVSVKFFAIHLFLMTIVLLLDDAKRIILLFMNKPVPPVHYPELLTTKKGKRIGYAIKSVILIYFVVTSVTFFKERMKNEHDTRNSYLSRLHRIEEFVLNGDTIPPLLTDTVRWRSISISGTSYYPDRLIIKDMGNIGRSYSFKTDSVQKTIVFHPVRDSTDKYFMKYEKLPGNHFVFYGKHNNDSLWLKTRAVEVKDYNLTKYGIRWIRDL